MSASLIEAHLEKVRVWMDEALQARLPRDGDPAATVSRAMRYAVLGAGKRLRPALCLAACEACGGDVRDAMGPAAALEMIHTYSLIHDDLPAMDDDDLRRGRPTVHVAFGEAEAVLAGDALQALAFEILASEPPGEKRAHQRTEALRTVARAVGVAGMVGGQMADLDAERRAGNAVPLDWIHAHKTGALLSASAEIGSVYAEASPGAREALGRYGSALGMAFQIADDILDVTSSASTLGKTPGKDARAGKATYPARFGLEGARAEAQRWVDVALGELRSVSGNTAVLEQLACFTIDRDR
jgi:geranylgeranyl pyrophosphate synthase